MINVVFLLLIFFLMTAQIAPPDPLEVTPPVADAAPREMRDDTLYLDADGALAFGTLRGDPAIAAAASMATLSLRADAGLPATDLAQVLMQLAAAGQTRVTLVTEPAP